MKQERACLPSTTGAAAALGGVAVLVLMVVGLTPVHPAGAALPGGSTTVEFEQDTFTQSEDAGVATVTLVRNGQTSEWEE